MAELIARLDARGHGTFVRAGLRDAERQEAFVALAFSETRRSAHLRGQAVDLVATVPLAWITRHAAYFHALREEAAALGLCSGGTWSRRGVWAFFELGWDPAHVQAGRCP